MKVSKLKPQNIQKSSCTHLTDIRWKNGIIIIIYMLFTHPEISLGYLFKRVSNVGLHVTVIWQKSEIFLPVLSFCSDLVA